MFFYTRWKDTNESQVGKERASNFVKNSFQIFFQDEPVPFFSSLVFHLFLFIITTVVLLVVRHHQIYKHKIYTTTSSIYIKHLPVAVSSIVVSSVCEITGSGLSLPYQHQHQHPLGSHSNRTKQYVVQESDAVFEL